MDGEQVSEEQVSRCISLLVARVIQQTSDLAYQQVGDTILWGSGMAAALEQDVRAQAREEHDGR
jgi:hypothetical protein